MKKILTLSLFLIQIWSMAAQSINLNNPLPPDTKIKKGVLNNGLTYYIYPTKVTKNAASYYIIQNVGSILENDDQKGLAHFLEHMAFNGTKNFEGKEIINSLQKVGIVFGKNINAYTSFDETVYNLDNVPATEQMIDKSLLILHDWSHYLLLTDNEIDAERGVIKEEWRTRQNAEMRIFEQSLPVYFNHSKYAQRMPIGTMEVVQNFKYKALRDFYHDWYRTDLQAIAVIGDINVDEIERKIKKVFLEIPPVKNPKERFVVAIDDNKEMLYNLAMDKEVAASRISFAINHPKEADNQKVSYLKKMLLISMTTTMLNARLREIAQSGDAPYFSAQSTFESLTRTTSQFSIRINPKPNQQQGAFKEVMLEINRAKKYGFTKSEISRTVAQILNDYSNEVKNENNVLHGQIANRIKQNYLENESITSIVEEYKIAQQILSNITEEDLKEAVSNLYKDENRVVLVTGTEAEKNLSKEEAVSIVNDAGSDNSLQAYKDEFASKGLMDKVTVTPGTIISEKQDTVTGATVFVLSNGAKVYYKYADKNKNDVKLTAYSPGGLSLVGDNKLSAASVVSNLAEMSGLGDYSASDLSKILSGKSAKTRILLGELDESIEGSSVTNDVECLLQQVYLRFEKPRLDENAFKLLKQNISSMLIRKKQTLSSRMQDSIQVSLYGKNNPRKRLFDEKMVDEITFEKVTEVYKDRFANAADFSFFIVGDIKKEDLKPFIEKYIAAIHGNILRENWVNKSAKWINGDIRKNIFLEMTNPKATINISFRNKLNYNHENKLLAQTLKDILKLRLLETIRENAGGTYFVGVDAALVKKPENQAYLSINFDCGADKADELVKLVYNEMHKIVNGDILQGDLDKTLANYIKDKEEQKNNNRYDMNVMKNYFIDNYNMDDPANFEDIIKKIHINDVQIFARKLLKNAQSSEIIFKPE